MGMRRTVHLIPCARTLATLGHIYAFRCVATHLVVADWSSHARKSTDERTEKQINEWTYAKERACPDAPRQTSQHRTPISIRGLVKRGRAYGTRTLDRNGEHTHDSMGRRRGGQRGPCRSRIVYIQIIAIATDRSGT